MASRNTFSRWRWGFIGLIAGLVVIAGIVVAVFELRDSDDEPSATVVSATPTTNVGDAAVLLQEEATVMVTDSGVDHYTVFVRAGGKVNWSNRHTEELELVSDSASFEAEIRPGDMFTWQATTPGIYPYLSENHPDIRGVIIVTAKDATAESLYAGKPLQQYFTDTCGGCHGPNREGGIGPALIPGRLTGEDDIYFDAIKDGRPGTIMPAWGPLGVSEEEVWGLIGYIRSQPDAASLEWGMDDIRNSFEVIVDEQTLPDSPAHTGNIDNLLLVTERESRSIAVIDGDTHTLLGKIEASYRAHGYAFDPTDERWAYNVGRDGWVFKIDLYTLQPVRKTRVGLDARGIAVSDDGKYVIIGNFIPNSAVILDADTLEPVKVIETEGTDPDGKVVESRVAITSDVSAEEVGPYFILALKEAGQMWRIDYSQPDFPIDKIENVGRILHDGFLSTDNRHFYIASQQDNWMAVIDVVNWELVTKIETGVTPHPGSGAVWEADGTEYGATVHAGEGKVSIWDLEINEIVGTVPTSGPGLFIRVAENSPYVWADAMFASPPNVITVFKKEAPFEIVGVIEEGELTLHPEFTTDGKYVYVADWTGNMVRVYDANTLEKVTEIPGIETPTGIFNSHRRAETLGH